MNWSYKIQSTFKTLWNNTVLFSSAKLSLFACCSCSKLHLVLNNPNSFCPSLSHSPLHTPLFLSHTYTHTCIRGQMDSPWPPWSGLWVQSKTAGRRRPCYNRRAPRRLSCWSSWAPAGTGSWWGSTAGQRAPPWWKPPWASDRRRRKTDSTPCEMRRERDAALNDSVIKRCCLIVLQRLFQSLSSSYIKLNPTSQCKRDPSTATVKQTNH